MRHMNQIRSVAAPWFRADISLWSPTDSIACFDSVGCGRKWKDHDRIGYLPLPPGIYPARWRFPHPSPAAQGAQPRARSYSSGDILVCKRQCCRLSASHSSMFVTTDDAFAHSINHFIRSRMRTLLLRLVILPRFEVELSGCSYLTSLCGTHPRSCSRVCARWCSTHAYGLRCYIQSV